MFTKWCYVNTVKRPGNSSICLLSDAMLIQLKDQVTRQYVY